MNELNNELIVEMSKPEAEGLWYLIGIVIILFIIAVVRNEKKK